MGTLFAPNMMSVPGVSPCQPMSAHVSPQESGARIEISKTENEGGKAGERTVYISGLQDGGTPVCQVWFAGFIGPLND